MWRTPQPCTKQASAQLYLKRAEERDGKKKKKKKKKRHDDGKEANQQAASHIAAQGASAKEKTLCGSNLVQIQRREKPPPHQLHVQINGCRGEPIILKEWMSVCVLFGNLRPKHTSRDPLREPGQSPWEPISPGSFSPSQLIWGIRHLQQERHTKRHNHHHGS